MNNILNEVHLENGLTVRLIDQTHHYFGGYYRVVLEIRCEIRVIRDFFSDQGKFAAALSLLGHTVAYSRRVEQLGVPATERVAAIERLSSHFHTNSLSYFGTPQFPEKMVRSELVKVKRQRMFLNPYAASNDE